MISEALQSGFNFFDLNTSVKAGDERDNPFQSSVAFHVETSH